MVGQGMGTGADTQTMLHLSGKSEQIQPKNLHRLVRKRMAILKMRRKGPECVTQFKPESVKKTQ